MRTSRDLFIALLFPRFGGKGHSKSGGLVQINQNHVRTAHLAVSMVDGGGFLEKRGLGQIFDIPERGRVKHSGVV